MALICDSDISKCTTCNDLLNDSFEAATKRLGKVVCGDDQTATLSIFTGNEMGCSMAGEEASHFVALVKHSGSGKKANVHLCVKLGLETVTTELSSGKVENERLFDRLMSTWNKLHAAYVEKREPPLMICSPACLSKIKSTAHILHLASDSICQSGNWTRNVPCEKCRCKIPHAASRYYVANTTAN